MKPPRAAPLMKPATLHMPKRPWFFALQRESGSNVRTVLATGLPSSFAPRRFSPLRQVVPGRVQKPGDGGGQRGADAGEGSDDDHRRDGLHEASGREEYDVASQRNQEGVSAADPIREHASQRRADYHTAVLRGEDKANCVETAKYLCALRCWSNESGCPFRVVLRQLN